MSLANLFNMPDSREDFLVFGTHNMDSHRLIVAALAQRGTIVPLFSLDPVDPVDPAGWLRAHQQAHNDFTAALGIEGVDLTDVDFQDQEQLSAWVRLHGEEHRQAANMLGIG